MARMRAVDAAVRVLEKEGVNVAFGVPGAAINPLYAAMKDRGSIRHILARHVEGASHMAEGYTRAKAGNIGVCLGTSGPAGTDMITGLYSASADSIPILCITGQAPRAKLDKELALTADVSIEADTRQPRINYQLETAREDGDRGQFAYVLTIRAAGAEPFEKLVTVTAKKDDSGDWSVTNYTEGDRSIAP